MIDGTCFLLRQVLGVETPDNGSKALTVCVRGKRALRFTEVRDFVHLAAKIRRKCGAGASPQHSGSGEVPHPRHCSSVSVLYLDLAACMSAHL